MAELITNWDTLVRFNVNPMEYPTNLDRLREVNPGWSFPSMFTPEQAAEYGFAKVYNDPYPESGDVITPGQIEKREDGMWYRPWNVRAFTDEELAQQLADLKPSLLDAARTLFRQQCKIGFLHIFGEDMYHVQVATEDRVNLHELNKDAKARIEANDDTTIQFRVYENVYVSQTPAEIVVLTDLAVQQVRSARAKIWAYKDAVMAATVKAELPAVLTDLFD